MASDSEARTEWRMVPEWPRYQVSRDGRVRAAGLTLPTGQSYPAREVALKRTHDGYMRCSLYTGSGERTIAVHRLVAMAFCPNPDGKPMVNHINGQKNDNRAENLEWVTNLENMAHAKATGLQPSRISREAWAIATERLSAGESMRAVARDLGVTWQAVQSRVRRSAAALPETTA